MDGQKESDKTAVPKATTPPEAKQPRRSFMDIRRPKTAPSDEKVAVPSDDKKTEATDVISETKPPLERSEPKPETAEKMEQAPPEEVDDPAQKLEEPKKKSQKTPKAPKPPKQPKQPGVGLAIFATIVIILGLGALATYAYLKSNNLAPF